jgi:hypothetical protein
MACVVYNTNINREAIDSPTQKSLLDLVESKIDSQENISKKEVFKILSKGLVTTPSGELISIRIPDPKNPKNEVIDKINVRSLVDLNMFFAINYGATSPVFNIKEKPTTAFNSVVDKNSPIIQARKYIVEINEEQLNSLQRLVSPLNITPEIADIMKVMTANVLLNSSEYNKKLNPVAAELLEPLINSSVLKSVTAKKATDAQLSNLKLEESRTLNLDSPETSTAPTIENLLSQIERLKLAFLNAGINVSVELDADIPVKGRAISMEDGTKKIVLNPLKITEDTLSHEFGHFLVEMLDGDPILERAFNELKDTNLAKEVKEKYPEYSDEDFKKELITTAIGLSGAKIQRQSPNLFQRIFNRIIRALSKYLGMEDNISAVEKMARMMLEDKIKNIGYKGTIRSFQMDSRYARLDKDFKNTIMDIRISLKNSIDRLKSQDYEKNEKAISRMEKLQEDLENIKNIEDILNFVEYLSRLTNRADELLEEVKDRYSENLSTSERLELIKKLYTVSSNLHDFYGGIEPSKSVINNLANLVKVKIDYLKKNNKAEELKDLPEFIKLSRVEQSIKNSLYMMSNIYNDYRDVGIPYLADFLLEYHPAATSELENEITEVINNIQKNKRLIALEKDEEYYDLKEYYDSEIEKTTIESEKQKLRDEFKEKLLELNVEQFKNKRINRETLIAELREHQKDKSKFSYLFDPLVYSSEAGIQMFSLALKNKMLEANEETLDTIYAVGEAYREHMGVIGGTDFNVNEVNKDILEVVYQNVYNRSTGEYDKMNLLSFVQPYDVNTFADNQDKLYKELNDKYKIPNKKEDRSQWFNDPKNKKEVKEYYAAVSKWYKDNGKISPYALSEIKRLERDKALHQKLFNKASSDKDADLMAYHSSQLNDIDRLLEKFITPFGEYTKNSYMPSDKYLNSKFTAMVNTNNSADVNQWTHKNDSGKYYLALLKEYVKAQKKIGKDKAPKNKWDGFSYLAPSILSDGLEKVQRDGAINGLKLMNKESINFLATDINYGDTINANKETRSKVVPVFYVNPTDEKLVSRDMASSIIMFAGMANMYEKKAELNEVVMLMANIIETRETLEVNASNNPIVNTFSKISGNKRYTKKLDKSNTFKHLQEWIDSIFFGEQELKSNFRNISVDKITSKLNSYTALNSLAFNVLQAGNQFILDNIRLVEERAAAQYYGKGNLGWAKATYYTDGLAQIKDIGAFSPSSKIGQAINMFDALGELSSIAYEERTGLKSVRLAKQIPMGLQKTIENETAVTRMLAVLDSFRGKILDKNGNVIKNEKGEDANVYDLLVLNKDTGRYELDSRIQNPDALKVKIRNRLSGLTKKTNQVKNKFDDAIIQRRWWGKTIMLFRRYFVPSLRRWWGHGAINSLGAGVRRDLELESLSEGMLHTFGRFVKETFYKNGKFEISSGVYANMTNFEKQNLRRLSVNMSFILLAVLIVSMLSNDDDDEESTYASQFLFYQSKRLITELTQFINPKELLKTTFSPMAAVRPIENSMDLLNHIFTEELPYFFWGDEDGLYYERKTGSHLKGDSKFWAKIEKLLPIISGVEKSSTPEEAAKWFNLGATSGK